MQLQVPDPSFCQPGPDREFYQCTSRIGDGALLLILQQISGTDDRTCFLDLQSFSAVCQFDLQQGHSSGREGERVLRVFSMFLEMFVLRVQDWQLLAT